MSHDRRPLSREEEDYYYHQRSQSQGGNNGYYDDHQGNPYAFYSQPQSPPDHGRNGSYNDHAIARDRDRERYYEDSDSVSFPSFSLAALLLCLIAILGPAADISLL